MMRRLFVFLLLALTTATGLWADDSLTQPWDTAYVDAQEYVNNRADSVRGSGRSFVGPGPILVHFAAEIPPTATYFVWEIARDQGFEDLEVQYHELLIDYEFRETGTFYARFVTANADNTEETQSEPYTIQVTESQLDIPNVITPDSPSGANQIFKVKYKSLVRFEMWIYNRWGNQLFHTKDPAEGWDGTYRGKTVPTGAYYYLIRAEGTDGIRYNRKGDINVLHVRDSSSSSATPAQ